MDGKKHGRPREVIYLYQVFHGQCAVVGDEGMAVKDKGHQTEVLLYLNWNKY